MNIDTPSRILIVMHSNLINKNKCSSTDIILHKFLKKSEDKFNFKTYHRVTCIILSTKNILHWMNILTCNNIMCMLFDSKENAG